MYQKYFPESSIQEAWHTLEIVVMEDIAKVAI
jgi:hypothetical protein